MSNLNISIDEIVGQHQTVYDVYFSQADSTGSGAIGALDAANFLKQSKLKDTVLKDIWELADPTGKGYLDRNAFYITLKLITLAQSSQEVKLENIILSSPAPKLGDLSSNITSLISPDDAWYIKASSRINFDKVFDSLSPINNKISGARVKPFLINSGLPVDVLGKIWELSDLDQDGQLDRDEFLIALQLIGKAKEGNVIPDQLPPSLLPFKVRHSSIPAPLGVGNGSAGIGTLPLGISLVNETKPWVVTFEEKTKSDIMFTQIDTDKDGYVSGLECKDVFLQTGLSQVILANIWSLCDTGSTGKLNCEQFALAMHFINKKLATGLDAPHELLPEMVPPSLRPKPVLTEDTHVSKEFEELQTQVTELQREKLYYEQRASEHDLITRQKRTELSNLELEMESLFKTLQEREMKKSEEQKKLAEFEDKLIKLDTQLKDLKEKYETENSAIEKLKLQIHHMETAMKSKDQEFYKIKTDLQLVINEQSNLDTKLSARKNHLNELNAGISATSTELERNKSKIELLKLLQVNINKLIKEYDTVPINSTNTVSNDLSEEIKKLEEENVRLKQEIEKATETAKAASLYNNSFSLQQNNNGNLSFSPTNENSHSQSSFQANFNSFVSPDQQQSGPIEDPFQTFDPFNNNDPFKSAPIGDLNKLNTDFVAAEDPFANAFDPFSINQQLQQQNSNTAFGSDDPFSDKKKAPPPRPAPPRPQTPSLKPTKKPSDSFQRPQSALDFTRNNKLDLFNDFSDPFQSNTNKINQLQQPPTQQIPNKDPFGAFNWDAFGSNPNGNSNISTSNNKAKDPFDPFG